MSQTPLQQATDRIGALVETFRREELDDNTIFAALTRAAIDISRGMKGTPAERRTLADAIAMQIADPELVLR